MAARAKARGRKTPEGIRASSINALRHGILARIHVLSSEDPEAFERVTDSYTNRIRPADDTESSHVEDLVAAYWRIRRARVVETEMMNKAIDDQPDGDELTRMAAAFVKLAATPEFTVLRRYETSFHRSIQRTIHSLLLLRAKFPNDANPISGQPALPPGDTRP